MSQKTNKIIVSLFILFLFILLIFIIITTQVKKSEFKINEIVNNLINIYGDLMYETCKNIYKEDRHLINNKWSSACSYDYNNYILKNRFYIKDMEQAESFKKGKINVLIFDLGYLSLGLPHLKEENWLLIKITPAFKNISVFPTYQIKNRDKYFSIGVADILTTNDSQFIIIPSYKKGTSLVLGILGFLDSQIKTPTLTLEIYQRFQDKISFDYYDNLNLIKNDIQLKLKDFQKIYEDQYNIK